MKTYNDCFTQESQFSDPPQTPSPTGRQRMRTILEALLWQGVGVLIGLVICVVLFALLIFFAA